MSQPMSVEPNEPIFYPESDGEPMGETDVHRRETMALIEMLDWRFRNDADVYVAGDNFLYYEEGNPKAVVSPDVYVVRGTDKGLRRVYKLWEEGAAPCFVMELSSRSTWLEDHGNKKAIYAMLGVREYLLFDPEADCLDPPLQAYRLDDDGEYHRFDSDGDGWFAAATLGLAITVDDAMRLQLRDATTGEAIPRADVARAQREAALHERDALAARVAELEAQLKKR